MFIVTTNTEEIKTGVNFEFAETKEQSLEILNEIYRNGVILKLTDVTEMIKGEKDYLPIDRFICYGKMSLNEETIEAMGGERILDYARWVMHQYDVPATMSFDFEQFRKKLKLFVTYNGERYRYTGHSRLGDVWISKDFKRSEGYDLRVPFLALTNFSKTP